MGTFAFRVSEGADGFVTFLPAGEPAVGEFRCSGCGYGVSIQRALPTCPMCSGTAWEAYSPNRWLISCQAPTTKAAEIASSTVSAM
jgi:rubredoxin